MKRSLLVQTLLDMATGSGGAKLEALVVDAAGTFDAGSGKGYNPVTVPSGTINVLGEKGVVSNNSVVVTPKAQVVAGWLSSGETSGSGVGVTASELVSGTLNVSSDGVQDVTNYQNINVPSAGHSASAHKGVATDHSIIVTPRSTATQGFVQAGTVDGTPVSVAASELVSGVLLITGNGTFDVTNLASVEVNVASSLYSAGGSLSYNPALTIPSSLVSGKKYFCCSLYGDSTGLSNALGVPPLEIPSTYVTEQSIMGMISRSNGVVCNYANYTLTYDASNFVIRCSSQFHGYYQYYIW